MNRRILCAALSVILCVAAAFPACGMNPNAGTPNPAPVSAMTDVPRDAYYADAVNWAMVNGITNGTTDSTFSPGNTCTRAQVVTFLWRAAGEPEPSDSRNPFEDVPESAYYRKAVLWAVEQGITNGTSATTFSPNQTCSLAHILTFLWRDKNSPDVDFHGALTTQYAAHWAANAIRWAEGTYMLGETAYDFQPGADCSRANALYYLYHSSVDTRIPMSAERFEGMQEISFSGEVYEAATLSGFVSAAMTLIQQYEDMSPDDFDDENLYASGRLIVNASETLPDLADYNAAQVVAGRDGHYIIQFHSAGDAESCAEYLESLSYVDYAEPDVIMKICEETSGDAVPPLSWGVAAVGADAYAAYLLKQGVDTELTVAVVDTGVDPSHPHLKDRIVKGYDFVKGDAIARDGNGHGTHVAGTIVDCTPGLNVKIMPIRVLDNDGSGYDSAIAQGIRYAVDHGAKVINLSLGGSHSNYMDSAVAYALSKSVTVVAAAGNEGVDAASSCPAHIEKCVTVAAVDRNQKRASFSNYGDVLDISAPGVEIRSSVPGGEYNTYNGTSMAAPHVAAAAALVLCGQSRELLPSIVEKKLKDAAISLGDATQYGAGLLNLSAFIPPEPEPDSGNTPTDSGNTTPDSGNTPTDSGNTPPDSGNTPTDSGQCGANLTWTLDPSGALTISGQGSMDDYTNASGAVWAKHREEIRFLRVENGVTTIGASAFAGCPNLTSITLPDSLESIGMSAFSNCAKLATLTISGSVERIGMSAFSNCSALSELTVSGSVSSVGMSAFANCSGLRSVRFSGSLTEIGMSAFANCANLAALYLPANVRSIGMSAFSNCAKLTDVYYAGSFLQWALVGMGLSALPYGVNVHFGV